MTTCGSVGGERAAEAERGLEAERGERDRDDVSTNNDLQPSFLDPSAVSRPSRRRVRAEARRPTRTGQRGRR